MQPMNTDPVSTIRNLSFQQGVVYIVIVGMHDLRQPNITKAFEKKLGIDEARTRNILKSLERAGLIQRIKTKGPGNPNIIVAPLDPINRYLSATLPVAYHELAIRLISIGLDEVDETFHLPRLRLLYLELLKAASVSFKEVRVKAPLAIFAYYTLVCNAVYIVMNGIKSSDIYRKSMIFLAETMAPPSTRNGIIMLSEPVAQLIDNVILKARSLKSIELLSKELIETYQDRYAATMALLGFLAQTGTILLAEALGPLEE